MELVFATNNPNKLKEIQSLVGNKIKIIGLKDIGFYDDIPEDHETLEENALQKARTISDKFNVNCFADDTGLEIEALDGRPGVFSARYAGPDCNSDNNMSKVLTEMTNVDNRKARFRTVIALHLNGVDHFFEGSADGDILKERSGVKGFGYDPIFKPEGKSKSFAEMELEEKNGISHRARAVNRFLEFLREIG